MGIGDLETIEEFRGWRLVLSPAPRRPLTPRERQIVDLVTEGRSQKEIAFELGVSNVTVRVLYSRAMTKLGRSRAAPASARGRDAAGEPGLPRGASWVSRRARRPRRRP